MFREVDTLNHHHFCNALPSILIGTEVGMPNKELIDSMLNNFFIIKTRSSQYALVKILSYIWEPSGVSYIKCISGINFLWILQSDGSTKFDIPTEINLKFIVRPSFNAKIAHEGTTYFTASGRFFRCSKKIKNNLIISKRNAVWSKNIEIKWQLDIKRCFRSAV